MNIWLVKDGENLPIVPRSRRMRTWMLGEELVRRGHSVTWWTSTFCHPQKRLIFDHDAEFEISPGFKLRLIYAGAYKRNFSIKRYMHHSKLAERFSECVKSVEPPDIIVSAYPIIHFAYEAMMYAKEKKIPFIVDIRDLWPDTIIDKVAAPLKKIARLLLNRDFKKSEAVLKNADSLVAISKGWLNWGLKRAGRLPHRFDRTIYTGYPEPESVLNHSSERMEKFRLSAEGKKVFTFIGTFGSSYKLQLVCDVASRMEKEGRSDIFFAMAGGGDQYDAIAKGIRSLSNITLLGWLDEEEIQQLLSFSYAGLAPLKMVVDAMPNKPYEYFSAGLPIISSLEGEMEDIIREYEVGYSYKHYDCQGLYAHILALADDVDLRDEMEKNARNLYKNKFSAKVVYGEYADLVEAIAGERSPGKAILRKRERHYENLSV